MNEGDRLLPSVALRPPRAPHVVAGQSPATTSDSRTPTLATCFLSLGALWAILHLLGRAGTWTTLKGGSLGRSLAGLAIVATLILVWRKRQTLTRVMTSLPFSVAVLTFLLVATLLGTLILQGIHPDKFAQTYGPTLTPILNWLGLNDIFHSLWFEGSMALLGLSLALTGLRRDNRRASRLGHLFAHLGGAVILLGAGIGHYWGFKGFIDLRKGEAKSEAVAMKWGVPAGEVRALGFSVRLEEFQLERHPADFRLYEYQRREDSYAVVKSIALKDAKGWTKLGHEGQAFKLVQAFPDFLVRSELKEAEAGKGPAGFQLDLGEAKERTSIPLLAGVTGREAALLPGEVPIQFVWDPPSPQALASLSKATSAIHTLLISEKSEAEQRELQVSPGQSYRLTDGRTLQVKAFLPDFALDVDSRQATSRSQEPNNPALQVVVEGKANWVLANPTEDHQGHAASPGGLAFLGYRFEPGRRPLPKAFLVIGATREVLRLDQGRVAQRSTLEGPSGVFPGLPAARYHLFTSAQESRTPGTRSETWENPVAAVELRKGNEESSIYMLSANHKKPLLLPDGKTVLAFERKADDVKAYRSKVAVLDGGTKAMEKTLAVNDPLQFRGYGFYQSNFREEDPDYSGLLVVKDPGLPWIWTGFAMICAGVAWAFYVRPRLLSRRLA